jgi:two-component system, LytTR family, sensor kinase
MAVSFLKKYYKKILGSIFIPPMIGILIILLSYPKDLFSRDVLMYALIYSYSLGLPFILVDELILQFLDKKISWLHNPLKRFTINALLEVGLVLILILMVHYFFLYKVRGAGMNEIYEKTLNAVIYGIFFIVGSIVVKNTVFFFRNWKQAAVNEEKLKREILTVEFEALKSQVNPHFLFNNLTALTSLVYKDQDKAARFINQLAEVYRYILEFGKEEIVSLATEKKLLNNFVYLYGIRYEDGLKINVNIPDEENRYIIPMALQILLENAIKHNMLSPENPLKVEIRLEGEYISVWNNLQPKTVLQPSNKLGLKNIQSRYKYLTEKEVFIERTETYFLVKISVLNRRP